MHGLSARCLGWGACRRDGGKRGRGNGAASHQKSARPAPPCRSVALPPLALARARFLSLRPSTRTHARTHTHTHSHTHTHTHIYKQRPSTAVRSFADSDGPDDAAASGEDFGNPLFANNPAFAAVFKSALGRSGGAAALATGPPAEEVPTRSGLEEVLHTALRNQRTLMLELEGAKKRIEAQLAREQRQFERLQFALKKSVSDHAYTINMDKLRVREKKEWEEERARLMKGE